MVSNAPTSVRIRPQWFGLMGLEPLDARRGDGAPTGRAGAPESVVSGAFDIAGAGTGSRGIESSIGSGA